MESPRIAVASPVPSTNVAASSPAASRIDFIMASAPRSMSPFMHEGRDRRACSR